MALPPYPVVSVGWEFEGLLHGHELRLGAMDPEEGCRHLDSLINEQGTKCRNLRTLVTDTWVFEPFENN
ncbi:MAG: hypothetical protein HRU47_01305 [Verrucomicrobiales bacterium]|nr:hypothetical protein [Verrucomicrobiales bacterium]